MARRWKQGESFTYVVGAERVFGRVTAVATDIAFDLFEDRDDSGTAMIAPLADTGNWELISEDLFDAVSRLLKIGSVG